MTRAARLCAQWRVVAGAAVFALVACDETTPSASITVDVGGRTDVVALEMSVVPSCSSPIFPRTGERADDAIRSWTLSRGEPIPDVGNIDAGAHGMYVRGLSAGCAVLAVGCTDFRVAREGTTSVVVRLGSAAGGASTCEIGEACAGGLCVPGPDAQIPADADDAASDSPFTPPPLEWTATFGAECTFETHGNATCNADSEGLRLTPAAGYQLGAGWAPDTFALDADTSFEAQFTLVIDMATSPPADGMAFVIRDDGAPTLGAGRSSLGYGPDTTVMPNTPPIAPSVAVEFDTYYEPGEEGFAANHVAIVTDGAVAAPRTGATPPDILANGTPVNVWVEYAGATNTLTVYVAFNGPKPGAPLLTDTLDLPALLGGSIRLGFTGGTGGLYQRQRITAARFQFTAPD